MKKKQFMSKLAALTMAAAMGVTALPATTVFAQTVSIEQSDTLATNVAVTKNGEAQDTTDHNSDAYKILDAVKGVTAPATAGKNNWISAFQATVESLITGKTFQVTDTTFNATTDTTGSVTLTDSDNAVWVITFTTIGKLADSANAKDQALAVALEISLQGRHSIHMTKRQLHLRL